MPPRGRPSLRRRGRPLARVLVALAAALLAAAPAAAAKADRPLVFVVVIDGLEGDRVNEGNAPFITSLLAGDGARATFYRESRAILIAETNPNHVAMMTGAYGDRSGTPGNAFALYAPLENEDSCKATGPVDESKLPTETSGENENCLQGQTAFEAIRRQGNPDGLVTAAMFGKPKLGKIFAGKNADPAARDADYIWAPCSSGPEDDDYCEDVPTNPITGYAIDDAAVMDRVVDALRNGVRVGRALERPDLFFVNLHQTDSAGHGFGTDSGIYDQAIAMADAEVQRLVTELRDTGRWQRTVLILLSDHGMDTTPGKTRLQSAFTGAGIDEEDFLIVDNGSIDGAYLADRTSPGRFELLKRMREAALASDGVNEALYREPNPADGGAANTLDGVHPAWRLTGPRTPDLFVTHDEGGAFSDPSASSNPLPGNHGGPQTRDNFFAVIGGGGFVRQQDLPGQVAPLFDDTLLNPRQSETVDVAPTVMGLLGLFEPRDNEGRFLDEAFERRLLPGKAAPALPDLSIRRRRGGRRSCRYRASWSPEGGLYDLQVRHGGRWFTLLRRSERETYDFRGPAGRSFRFRVRSRAESGVHSDWAVEAVGSRRGC